MLLYLSTLNYVNLIEINMCVKTNMKEKNSNSKAIKKQSRSKRKKKGKVGSGKSKTKRQRQHERPKKQSHTHTIMNLKCDGVLKDHMNILEGLKMNRKM